MGNRLSDQSDSLIYELSAILIHKGTAVNSGHYVAHIKDENSGKWWEFDDEHVSELSLNPANKSGLRASSGDSVSNGFDHEETFSSTDAYMLMYSRINTAASANLNVKNSSLPLHFSKEIEEMNESYESACKEYQDKKDREVACITERRQEVKSILSEAPVHPYEDSYFWISTDWLRQWADNITAPL